MDRQHVMGLLDKILGSDTEIALGAAKALRDLVQRSQEFPAGFAYSVLNCIDALMGKWGPAKDAILKVSVNTMRAQLGESV